MIWVITINSLSNNIEKTLTRRMTIDPKSGLIFYIRSPAPANHPVSTAIYSRPLGGGSEKKIYTFTHSHNQFYQFFSNVTVVDPVADPFGHRLYWAEYFKLGFNAKDTGLVLSSKCLAYQIFQ